MNEYNSNRTGSAHDSDASRLSNLETDNSTQSSQITTLNNQVSTLQTTVSTLQTQIAQLSSLLNNSDFVISTGTSDIWTTRIWKSGKKECFAKYSTYWSAAGGTWSVGKYNDFTFSFPSGFFSEAPTVSCIIEKLDGSGMPFTSTSYITKNNMHGYLWEAYPASSTTNYSVVIHIHAFGI